MSAEDTRQPTGYPPVTAAEERAAEDTRSADDGTAVGSGRLDADAKATVDALTEVFDRHRRRIDEVALDPALKRCAFELLDAVFLDSVQAILSEAPRVS